MLTLKEGKSIAKKKKKSKGRVVRLGWTSFLSLQYFLFVEV